MDYVKLQILMRIIGLSADNRKSRYKIYRKGEYIGIW